MKKIDTHIETRELARRWKMHKNSIQNMRCKGYGPKFIKIGSRVLYALEDIENWENKHKQRSTVG